MLIHGQRETQWVINIIIAGNGLTLTQPALLPQNLSPHTDREKGGWVVVWMVEKEGERWKDERMSENEGRIDRKRGRGSEDESIGSTEGGQKCFNMEEEE